jgi:hypothetical protein
LLQISSSFSAQRTRQRGEEWHGLSS